jgi:hypothetical protein
VFSRHRLICQEIPKENPLAGGASLLLPDSFAVDSVQFYSGAGWSITTVVINSLVLVPIYLDPSNDRDSKTAAEALVQLEEVLRPYADKRIIVAGDFNAPSHTKRRFVVNTELSSNGFILINPNVTSSAKSGYDLDLIWERSPLPTMNSFSIFKHPALFGVPGIKTDHAILNLSIADIKPERQERKGRAILDVKYLADAVRILVAAGTDNFMHGVRMAQLAMTLCFKKSKQVSSRKLAQLLLQPGAKLADINMALEKEAWSKKLSKFAGLKVVPPELWALFNKSSSTWKTKAEAENTVDFFKNIYSSVSSFIRTPIIEMPSRPEAPLDILFTGEELREALKTVSLKKSPGPDLILPSFMSSLLTDDSAAATVANFLTKFSQAE